MIKVVALLIYLWQSDPVLAPELVVERRAFDDETACADYIVTKRGPELIADPHFYTGVYANCIPSRVTEAKN